MTSFGLWLDIFCGLFVAAIVFSFVILSEGQYNLHIKNCFARNVLSFIDGGVSGALAGLAISQSLSLSGMLQHGMKQTAEVVNQLTSVERIMTYTKLDQEGPFESPKGNRRRSIFINFNLD